MLNTLDRPIGLAESMEQWELHELRGIFNWLVNLTDLAEEMGLDLPQVAALVNARWDQFEADRASEFLRRRAA